MMLSKELYLMAVAAVIDTSKALQQPLMAVDGYTGDGTQAAMVVAIGDDAVALLQWVKRQGSVRTIELSPIPGDN